MCGMPWETFMKGGIKMTKLKNFLKLLIPYLIAILSFIGGKYQFNNAIEILILSLVISYCFTCKLSDINF